ncbi:menaquinone-dependent protoporphyrinogen IX dehydrogenase [Flavobacterium sp. TSSA_36]|uniref:menaquinone-dependent protoporphyrinogen IX dehydrogenase n=1 Tax=Flavobacterium sp. TSSA_36 TaxID=3447669 RepID=UPI003F34CBB8
MDEKNKIIPPILIVYASVDGMTKRICHYIQENLIQNNHAVDVVSIDDFNHAIEDYDKIIIASSIRYGKHHPKIITLIEGDAAVLNTKKSAFISVNLVARKPEKRAADTNPYVIKFLKTIAWKPELVGVIAGKLDYPHYGFWDRIMIQLIMWITKGPTDPHTVIEYIDWEQVDKFVKTFSEL